MYINFFFFETRLLDSNTYLTRLFLAENIQNGLSERKLHRRFDGTKITHLDFEP